VAYFSEYWTMRPFFDHAIQFGPGANVSARFSTRMTRGASLVGGLATLQTLRSPSEVWVASMSDFCFDEEACQARFAIADGPLDVLRVWRIVKAGCSDAKRIDPFLYLLGW
jgi:hypothetical protein